MLLLNLSASRAILCLSVFCDLSESVFYRHLLALGVIYTIAFSHLLPVQVVLVHKSLTLLEF